MEDKKLQNKVENIVKHIFNKLGYHGYFKSLLLQEGYEYDDIDSTPDTYMVISIGEDTPYAFMPNAKIKKYDLYKKYINKKLIKKYNIIIW